MLAGSIARAGLALDRRAWNAIHEKSQQDLPVLSSVRALPHEIGKRIEGGAYAVFVEKLFHLGVCSRYYRDLLQDETIRG